jgi:hypothetical protein
MKGDEVGGACSMYEEVTSAHRFGYNINCSIKWKTEESGLNSLCSEQGPVLVCQSC